MEVLTNRGRKIIRRLLIISGILLGFGFGVIVGVKVAPHQTFIDNEYGKVKNKGGSQDIEQSPVNNIDTSKKKEKKGFLWW